MIEYETLIHRGSTGSGITNIFEVRVLRPPDSDLDVVNQYIDSLELRQQKKVHKSISLLAQRGPTRNREKFNDFRGYSNLYELKEKPSRIFYFYDGPGIIVLTHGFNKHGNSTPQTEIDRAVRLRGEYQEAKARR